MPITKSAIKRARQAKVRETRNAAYELRIKNLVKKLKKTAAHGGKTEIDKLLTEIYSAVDKAVSKHVIHKNTGARYKSRLVKSIKARGLISSKAR